MHNALSSSDAPETPPSFAPGVTATRSSLFGLLDTYLRANIAALRPAPVIASDFGISERTFHRIFADRGTTFERHVLQLRVEMLRNLLRQASLADSSIAQLAMQCGFADAAHATRTFKNVFVVTPREFRANGTIPAIGA